MRLLIFSPYFSPHVGGVESYVRDLNNELLRLGLADAITVLTARIPAEGASRERLAPGYEVVRYPAFDAIPNFPTPALWRRGTWRAARQALRPRGHDVVVCHTRFFISSLLALGFSWVSGLPLIHIEHGSDSVHLSSRGQSTAARLYDRSLGRLVLRRAQAVVGISHASSDFVRRLAQREATVIYRGVDHERYEAVRPSSSLLGWARGRPVVAFVGRLIDGKGVADLVQAFARLEASQAVLCIVGDGPRRAELERLCAALGIEGRTLFTGYVAESLALELMRAADVVVNPSYTEGLPTSVLEAALLERAIVATDVGGTSEIVADGHSALLTFAGDIDGLGAALGKLLEDPGLRLRLGRAAREDVGRRFDRRASAERFTQIARQLTGPS